jgi:hypothetical protein
MSFYLSMAWNAEEVFSSMHDAEEEHSLVCKAVRECLGGCFEWDERGARPTRQDSDLDGLTPEFLRREVSRHVKSAGIGVIVQVAGTREGYRDDYRFYCKRLQVAVHSELYSVM